MDGISLRGEWSKDVGMGVLRKWCMAQVARTRGTWWRRGEMDRDAFRRIQCRMLEAYGEQLIILPPLWVPPSEDIDMKNQMGMTGSALSDLLKKVVKSHVINWHSQDLYTGRWLQSLCS